MSKTKIAWTEQTWNPIVGCTRISPGCQHCYAERMAKRLIAMGQEKYKGTIDKNDRWSGVLNFGSEKTLNEPIRNCKPTMYFVNSMSDLFHEALPFWMIKAVWQVMYNANWHTFQILTKRAEFMKERTRELSNIFGLLPNVWLGVSVENQQYADERIPHLLQTPAVVRFLSCEPLLGPIDLTGKTVDGVWIDPDYAKLDPHLADIVEREGWWINWVIVGGESGPDARPMKPEWARSLRDQCQAAGVPFFFKQWGGVNKKAAGRLLDGVEWSQFPQEIKV